MKLIINIDDNSYELINKTSITLNFDTVFHGKEKDKELTFAIFNLVKALKNGTPYEERPHENWIPVSERLPEEKLFNPSGSDFGFDFEEVLCTTIFGDVRAYKFGKPIGHDKPHFWLGGGIMDEYVIAWQPLPEPYKKGGADES